MIKFRTEIEVPQATDQISHNDNVFLIGSCFTENIGNILKSNLFNTSSNPTGIIYNPLSIAHTLDLACQNKHLRLEDLSFSNERWFSYTHHSVFSNTDKQKCLAEINTSITNAHEFILKSNFLIITLGTAFTYFLKENVNFVANCHKQPSTTFDKRMLSVNEITEALQKSIQSVQAINPNIRIIFTISPVRHWKDGAIENQLSKSTLNVAVHQLINNNKHLSYFPAYEIMMDDLRDYRFYAEDLIHPSKQAVDYIFEKFAASYFSNDTRSTITTISKLRASSEHRPFNTDSDSWKTFINKHLEKINELKKSHPNINWTGLEEKFLINKKG